MEEESKDALLKSETHETFNLLTSQEIFQKVFQL